MILTPSQKQIAKDNTRFRVVCCGRRFGKTTLAIQEILGKAVFKATRIAYIAPTYQQARDIAWNELKRILEPIVKDINESRLEITVKNKQGTESTIFLRGWESIETLRGQAFDFLVVDEIAMMRSWEHNWNEVLRPTLTDRKGQALFISTPKGFNHFYDLFQLEKDAKRGKEYKSFQFSSYDNPHLPKEELEKAKAELSEEAFTQEYLAQFHKSTGLALKHWDRKINLIDNFELSSVLQRIRGFDYGSVDPTASVRIVLYENTWIVERCYKQQDRLIGDHALEVLAQDYGYGFIPIYGDPSGEQWEKEFSSHNLHIQSADKTIGTGYRGWVEYCIAMVNSMFKPIPGNTVFINGKEIQNCPKMLVLNTPENMPLVEEIERLSWREDKEGKNVPILDDDGDKMGHFDLIAALRYAVVSHKTQDYTPRARKDWSLA